MNEFIASWIPEIEPGAVDEDGVRRLMAEDEGENLEFKSSLRWDLREERISKDVEHMVVKALAGFLNGQGGTLLIGVDDAGGAVGLGADYRTLKKRDRDGVEKRPRDVFELHLQGLVVRYLGEAAYSAYLTVNFHEIDGEDICQVTAEPSDHAIYVDHKNEAVKYVQSRWECWRAHDGRRTRIEKPKLADGGQGGGLEVSPSKPAGCGRTPGAPRPAAPGHPPRRPGYRR